MVMIARDEQANVAPCLKSLWEHVDEVVFVDTGSQDRTIDEAVAFAQEQGDPMKFALGQFEWCDDFAAARAYAHSLATGDVHCRIDLDDRLVGGEHLRSVCLNFEEDPGLVTLMALWSGPITPTQWRGQIFRAEHEWRGRTYEYPHFETGRLGATDLVRWHHTRTKPRGRRDLDIALAWADAEPENWRPLNAAAEEAMILGEHELAADCCAKALERDPPIGTRAYFLGVQARARLEGKDFAGARKLARQALKIVDSFDPDEADFLGVGTKAWTTLLRCEMVLRDREIKRCAKRAMETATTEEGKRAVIDLVTKLERRVAPLPPRGGTATTGAPVRWLPKVPS